MGILTAEFYTRADVTTISRELLGKFLLTRINGHLTGGMISETEAYGGVNDRACHAFGGRRTRRNEVMYAKGGLAYVYRCYGIHWLLNIVTNEEEIPDAVLIRAIKPTLGIDIMQHRRGRTGGDKNLTSGPGNLTRALGIDGNFNGASLYGPTIWLEDRGINPESTHIMSGPRIGVDYAGLDSLRPWRFWLAEEINPS